MIKAGVGFSKNSKPDLAAREAVLGALKQGEIKKADLILVFATSHFHHDYPLILSILHEMASPKQLFGCSAYGVLTDKEEIEQAPGIAVLALSSASLNTQTFQVHDILERNSETGKELAELLKPAIQKDSLLFLFPDTFSFRFDSFFKAFADTLSASSPQKESKTPIPRAGLKNSGVHIPFMVGGGASEQGNLNETFQFCGRTVASNSVSGCLLSGKFQYEVGVTHACHPIGASMMVTRAKGNILYEICGEPAYQSFTDLFRNKLHYEQELQDAASLVFLGLGINPCDTSLQNKEYVVRNILALDPEEGSITISDQVEEGQVISYMVRNPQRAYQEAEEMISGLAKKLGDSPPLFGIYINCCGRGNSLYGKKNVDTTLIRKHFGNIPLIGFFSYAEVAPTQCGPQWHNYSGVLTIFSQKRRSKAEGRKD
jgi:small ligand-binding sensory domain FIST